MQSLRRTASVFATLGVAIFLLAAYAGDMQDPLYGTWMLRVEKSSFGQVPGPKGQLVTYAFADGFETMTSHGMNSEGNPTKVSYKARYDGKDYTMVGSLGGETITLRRIDAFTTESTEKRAGKVTITALRRVSPDGKTMTEEFKGTLSDGRMLNSSRVFDRR